MSLFGGILGNASEKDAAKVQKEYQQVFVTEETVQAAFAIVRDTVIFTYLRLILVDKQGLTGKKVEYMSIPYKSIKYFSVETGGHFDTDAELKIWVSNDRDPTIERELKKGIDVVGLQKTLAYFVLSGSA
jgi:hypothetical protein